MVPSGFPAPVDRRWGVWFSSSLSTLLPSHRHDCPELNLITSGSMVYRTEHSPYALEGRAGQLIVLPAGVRHELVRTSEDLALWVIELNGIAPLPWLETPAVLTPESEWRKGFQDGIRRLWLRPPLAETLAIQAALGEALRSLRLAPGPADPERIHPAVLRAKNICEAHAERELVVGRLAKNAGISASRLAHLFADQVGVTPLQYRNFARVQRFIRSYDGSERNLMRAALLAGFGSYAQFHRVFCQVCGSPPAVHFKWLLGSAEVDAQRTLAEAAGPRSRSPSFTP